jgi:IS6 family transposase
MDKPALFTWRHCTGEIIVCGVRRSLRYALSDRDVEELLRERGVAVDHTTVFRWGQRYAPELDKRCRSHLTETNDSYRVNETSIKIKKRWYYLYRAVDSASQTIDFLLSAQRDTHAAERCFRKALRAQHTATSRVITVDKNVAYPPVFETLQQEGQLPASCTLRQCKSFNNVVEQDHRSVKRRVNPGLGIGSFRTARRTLQGYAAMHMIRKGQVTGGAKGEVLAQHCVIAQMFGLVA